MTTQKNIRSKIIEFRNSRDKKAFIKYFSESRERLEMMLSEIWELSEHPYKEYASWMFLHIVKSGKIDCSDYYSKLVDTLFKTEDQTVLRNTVNALWQLEITSYRSVDLIDKLIGFIQDSSNKVALQVYSIYLLIQFCERYPELIPEIREVIEINSEGKSAAYRVAHQNFEKRMIKASRTSL